jgi:hypothetical protein
MSEQLDDGTLESLRNATTKLGLAHQGDIDRADMATKIEQYKAEIRARLEDKCREVVRTMNHLAAMLWNARVPDKQVDENFEVYEMNEKSFHFGTHASSWQDEMETGVSGAYVDWTICVSDKLRKKDWGLAHCFDISETEYAYCVEAHGNGDWRFCFSRGREQGGATSTQEFVEKMTAKLAAHHA